MILIKDQDKLTIKGHDLKAILSRLFYSVIFGATCAFFLIVTAAERHKMTYVLADIIFLAFLYLGAFGGGLFWTIRILRAHRAFTLTASKSHFEIRALFQNWQLEGEELEIKWHNNFFFGWIILRHGKKFNEIYPYFNQKMSTAIPVSNLAEAKELANKIAEYYPHCKIVFPNDL